MLQYLFLGITKPGKLLLKSHYFLYLICKIPSGETSMDMNSKILRVSAVLEERVG